MEFKTKYYQISSTLVKGYSVEVIEHNIVSIFVLLMYGI